METLDGCTPSGRFGQFTLALHGCRILIDMSRIAVRLLLALCLVLNGIGSAMAAVAMPTMGAGSTHATVSMPDAEPQFASLSSHGAGHDASLPAPEVVSAPPVSHPADCDQDCCAQEACSGACMQLVQAALLDMAVLSADPGRARMAAAFPLGHATPVLLHLIRPPIG